MDMQDRFYKEEPDDKVWWLDNADEVVGEFVFSFDKKKTYNLFRDYPHKLSIDEWRTFNRENRFWVDFFEDRNKEYEKEHAEELRDIH